MPEVLVADTSIIIDLWRGGILECAFRTRYSVLVPDVLYERELAHLEGPQLVELGLRVERLDGRPLDSRSSTGALSPACHWSMRSHLCLRNGATPSC